MVKTADWFFGPKGFRYTFPFCTFVIAYFAIMDILTGQLFWGAWLIVCLIGLYRSAKSIMRSWY